MALNPGTDTTPSPANEPPGPITLQHLLENLRAQGLGHDITEVIWLPDEKPEDKLAEVQGQCILIYSEDLETAKELVTHEVVHYEIARAIEPYLLALNALLNVLGDTAQDRTERLANRLTDILEA